MRFLYARISSATQQLDRQLVNADDYDRVYTEKLSGKNKDRPELNNLLKALRKGDVIECASLDRLARNLKDLLDIVETIQHEGATIHFKKENMTFTDKGDCYSVFGKRCRHSSVSSNCIVAKR